MPTCCVLYTVTGGREPIYAAVDRATGRFWTSPSYDGAKRQAIDAGMDDNFIERRISKEAFLESMGVKHEPPASIPMPAPKPQPVKKKKRSIFDWFVSPSGDRGTGDDLPSLNQKKSRAKPDRKASKKKSDKSSKSPFSSNTDVTPNNPQGGSEDPLIVRRDDKDKPSPFA